MATLFVLLLQGVAVGTNDTSHLVKAMPSSGKYCGDAQNNHCYAIESWYGAWGSKTSITIVPLSCNVNGGCDFINDEMWLGQYQNSQCPGSTHKCWVEVGYTNNLTGGNTENYFWADQRPSSPYYLHPLGDIPVGDYNKTAIFEIGAVCGSGCFEIDIFATKENYFAESTNNSMNPTGSNSTFDIGIEMAGSNSNGASANQAYFLDNEWYSSGSWNLQTNIGYSEGPISSMPPWMYMPVPPANGNEGGQFYTDCCSSTGAVQPLVNASGTESSGIGIAALKPLTRQPNGAMFDNGEVSSFVLTHRLPHTIRNGSTLPTTIQKIVYAKSQDISKLLGGENLGVPAGTLVCYVQVSGTFVFPSLPGTTNVVYRQGVEVFDATTGNLILAGG